LPADKTITVYGEAYGGSQQKMSATYGNQLKFIAFDVCIGDAWLSVPDAEQIVKSLGLEFVHYTKVKLTKAVKRETGDDMWDVVPSFDELDAHRDAPSIQAVRNGIVEPKPREGIVCRPLKEVTLNNGHRLIVKHKGDAFKETATPREASIDPARLAVLADADAVASEWVTPMRLAHVLDKIPEHGMEKMREIITAMVEDVMREGAGEIVDSREVRKAISTRTTTLYKQSLMERKHE
jgi:hypothetical protein